jgi:hypothetical protein
MATILLSIKPYYYQYYRFCLIKVAHAMGRKGEQVQNYLNTMPRSISIENPHLELERIDLATIGRNPNARLTPNPVQFTIRLSV